MNLPKMKKKNTIQQNPHNWAFNAYSTKRPSSIIQDFSNIIQASTVDYRLTVICTVCLSQSWVFLRLRQRKQ